MRSAFRILAAAAALAMPSAAFGQASTTRIETRPFYGATVTLEEGVRVFRPLPPHDRVIINPGARTNLSLGYHESRNYNIHGYAGGPGDAAYGYGVGGVPLVGPGAGRGHGYRTPTAAKRNIPIGRQHSAPMPVRPAPGGHAKH